MSELLEDLINSNDIESIIKRNEKESLNLEYKGGEWLKNDDSGKFDIRKWISSFANSAGGTLIIGISEKKVDNEIFPDKIDGIDATNFKEEIGKWIEDVLKEKIYPRLNPPPKIYIFPTNSFKKRFVAAIEIQQTNFYIHKVMDRGKETYFHRHNFQVLSMDEWEIRTLLFGRIPPPLLDLSIERIYIGSSSNFGRKLKSYVIDINIENIGWQIAKYLQLGIIRPLEDFESELNSDTGAIPVKNQKKYLPKTLNNFFELENPIEIIVDTITFLKPDFLHPYDSHRISYKILNREEFPVFDKICFGIYIMAENLLRPEIYSLKILHLGKDQKPNYEFHPYDNKKIKIFAWK